MNTNRTLCCAMEATLISAALTTKIIFSKEYNNSSAMMKWRKLQLVATLIAIPALTSSCSGIAACALTGSVIGSYPFSNRLGILTRLANTVFFALIGAAVVPAFRMMR